MEGELRIPGHVLLWRLEDTWRTWHGSLHMAPKKPASAASARSIRPGVVGN